MKVLSLFDGMSCARIALDRAAIPVTSYKASELDKYAIKVSHANYPDIEQLGDVCDVKAKDVGKIDLLIGGSPCQDLSFAGKGKGLKEGTRSSLFFEFVRLKNELNPKYFILENVRMKQENQDIISEYLGVKPKQFNSSLVSAQNRNRLFWTNIDFDLPDDKGIILADILEDGVTDRGKSHCLDANYFKGGNLKSYFEKHRRQLVFNRCIQVGEADIKGFDIIKRVYSPEGKAPTLTTMGGGHREPKVACGSMIGRRINPDTGKRDDYNKDIKPVQRIEIRADSKTGTLTTVQKDNLVVSPIRDKSKTVRSGGRGSYDRHEWDSVDKLHWRKLTPLECERLQTVPDNYTNHVSNTQRYKMLGNGFTVDVVAHILKGLH